MKRAFLLAALLAAGCGGPPPPAGPRLDTTALFPDLAGVVPASAEEERPVPLAGALAALLPAQGWRSYAGPGITVLSHLGPDGSPDALVWAEVFSPLGDHRPSDELSRFILTVDPALVRETGAWPDLPASIAPAAGRVSPRRMRQAAAAAMTRTGGRGIGFASARDGFSGWRWAGFNERGTFLRLAASRGTWGEPALLPLDLEPEVKALVAANPRLEWLGDDGLGQGDAPRRAPSMPPIPAALVLGNASGPQGRVHLALLCRRAPVCAPAADLARLLESMRPAEAGDLPAREAALPLGELGYELGIPIAPEGALLDPLAPPAR